MSSRRAAFAFIFVTVLLDMLALGLIVPVLPKLVVGFMQGDTARGAQVFALFGTVWAAMQFVSSPVLGALSDRFGRRPVILLSNVGLGLDYMLMAWAPTLAWLFVGRVISGISSASIATAYAYIADVTPPEKRAAAYGMTGAAFGMGFILGPAVGGELGAIDARLPFWVAGGLSLANALYGLFVLPESLPAERRGPLVWRRAHPFGALAFMRAKRELLVLGTVGFLSYLAHVVLPSTFVLYATYRYGWDERVVGRVLATVGVCSLIVQAGLVGRVVRRVGERRTLLAGLFFGMVGFACYGFAPTGTWFLLAVPVVSLWGLAGPTAQGLMTRQVEPGQQGQLQGAIASMRGVADMVGPAMFPLIFAAFIDDPRGVHLPGAPYLLAALFLAAAWFLSFRVAGQSSSSPAA